MDTRSEAEKRLADVLRLVKIALSRDLTGMSPEYVKGFFEGMMDSIMDVADLSKKITDREPENKIITGLKEALSLARDGHGHVRPRKDGMKARCGGPAICSECAKEAALYRAEINTGSGVTEI